MLKEDHYLRWKGIMRFEEEGESLMDRLVSREERITPKDMNFRTALTYDISQKLYEKRLKLTKALPIIQHEMLELESENKSKISLYITQKSEFTASLRMLIDQIDSILRRDDSQQQTVGLPALKTPIYYPSGVDLWAEMPAKIILKKAAEEHKECMMSMDDARSRQQIKHIDIRKTSKGTNNIPLMTSAFQRVHPFMSEGREASPAIKERGHQEAIKMAAEVQDWNKREPCLDAGGNLTQKLSILTKTKEIAATFSAVMGQEISEEEVSLIPDIHLPEEEMNSSTKDTEASEVSEGK